jgi:hypothetical protein
MSDAKEKGSPGGDRFRRTAQRATLLLSSLLLIAGAGCVSTRDAIGYVAKNAACPPEQLTAVERPDVNAVDYAASYIGGPNAEIAANPERLAYWRKTQIETWQGLMGHRKVFEIRGCTIHNLIACRDESDANGGGSQIACSWLDKPLAIQRRQLVE